MSTDGALRNVKGIIALRIRSRSSEDRYFEQGNESIKPVCMRQSIKEISISCLGLCSKTVKKPYFTEL